MERKRELIVFTGPHSAKVMAAIDKMYGEQYPILEAPDFNTLDLSGLYGTLIVETQSQFADFPENLSSLIEKVFQCDVENRYVEIKIN